MSNWYTDDSHFGFDSVTVLQRDNRLFYATISVLFSLPFSLAVNTLFKRIDLFWSAETCHLTIVPILILLPVLALLGAYIPCAIYGNVRGTSIVDDLRTNE